MPIWEHPSKGLMLRLLRDANSPLEMLIAARNASSPLKLVTRRTPLVQVPHHQLMRVTGTETEMDVKQSS